jgi:hypothetical protein
MTHLKQPSYEWLRTGFIESFGVLKALHQPA